MEGKMAGGRWHERVVASFYLDFPHSDAYGIAYFFINGKSMNDKASINCKNCQFNA
jgi:hypothetical protein|tara:strand:- start:158 stop:325 length:168 start_codon:yes stop_codon:yes gene_type:complete